MLIREAHDVDVVGILDIYNHAVVNTTAIWNDNVVDLANRRAWLADRRGKNYPVLVAVEGTRVLGYASFGDWRPFDGYRFTVEHSVYVHHEHQRRGIGKTLMVSLIEHAAKLRKHVMVAVIEANNQGSIQLHAELGFTETGRMPQVGTKFGKWLDLVFMQLQIDQRSVP